MIDASIRRLVDPPLAQIGQLLAAAGISADAVTVGGCLIGLTAALAASAGEFYIALALLIANRVADGLDGALGAKGDPTGLDGLARERSNAVIRGDGLFLSLASRS